MKTLHKIKLILTIICITFCYNGNANDKNILIIGGSSGIGKALVQLYNQEGCNVYYTFNNTVPDEVNSVNKAIFIKIDLLNHDSINKIFNEVKPIKFETIIYNAGKFGYNSNIGPKLDRQDWIDSFIINSIAPVELAFALQDNFIPEGGKYVVITSRRASNTINIEDKYAGRYSYRSSKAALNSALVALSMDFKEKGISVLMLHPGQVKTKMTKYQGMETEESAILIKNTIDQNSLIDTGKFIDVQNNNQMPW